MASYYADPVVCLHCEKVVQVPDGVKVAEVKKKRFCNQSCAAAYNNRHYPRRQKQPRTCKGCAGPNPATPSGSYRVYCKPCWALHLTKMSRKTKADANRGEIAYHARGVMNGRMRFCETCGYSKHVEVCHRVAVYKFPTTATLAEINAPSNLMYLCPNCHWELDHPSA